MTIDSQIEIPQSFMLMYVTRGQSRPNATREAVTARYEQCEDMACMLMEHARMLAFTKSLTERDVLGHCHQGLLDDASDFNVNEARWVILRLAELLGWAMPEYGEDSVALPACGTSEGTQ